MARPKSESTDSLLARLVSAHWGDEGSSLAPFWDRLVADGFTTTADDARRVLEMIGAYKDPRIPFTRGTPTRISGVDTEHKRAIMRVTANIREAQRRARNGGALGVKAEADRIADITVAVRRAVAAGIGAERIGDAGSSAIENRTAQGTRSSEALTGWSARLAPDARSAQARIERKKFWPELMGTALRQLLIQDQQARPSAVIGDAKKCSVRPCRRRTLTWVFSESDWIRSYRRLTLRGNSRSSSVGRLASGARLCKGTFFAHTVSWPRPFKQGWQSANMRSFDFSIFVKQLKHRLTAIYALLRATLQTRRCLRDRYPQIPLVLPLQNL